MTDSLSENTSQPVELTVTSREWDWLISLVREEIGGLKICVRGSVGYTWRKELKTLEKKLREAR